MLTLPRNCRRFATALALLALALTSCAATLTVRGTTPSTVADGPCSRPIESPASAPMWVICSVAGITDSLLMEPGAPFRFSFSLPAGSYAVTAFARNGGGASCSSSVVAEALSRPSAVRLTP